MIVALAALGLTLMLVVWRYAPPPARPAQAPAAEFSAARARLALARALAFSPAGDVVAHPTGSAANAAVRERLAAVLRGLGLRPVVEERRSCGRWGRCATVSNLLAIIPGRDPRLPAVLLACHYDSVAAGPGAADDGAGVATTLEVARALLARPRLLREVWLLLDDGEEPGLLGAEAFVRDAARRSRISAVINVEARGTTGPSLLFELSPGNARLVSAVADALPRPVTNSIYYTLYQRLPNDTDLTVFKREGLAGVNFAFVGGPLRYHTPRDDLAHLDGDSLQHLGDHALAMARALGDAGGSWHARRDDVFFDFLTFRVVRWPERWTLPLALAGALLVLVAVWLTRRRAGAGGRPLVGAACALGAVLVAAGLGWALAALLRRAGALPYQWVAHGGPARLAFWSLGVAVAALVAWLAGDRLRARGVFAATWIGWALLAVVAAAAMPGVSYPLVVPMLIAGLAGVLGALAGLGMAWVTLAPLLAAALLFFPLVWMLDEGMGTSAMPAISALVALVLTGALPAFAVAPRRTRALLAVAAAVAVLAGALGAWLQPPFTADAPRPLSLVLYHDAEARQTRWIASAAEGSLPPALARDGGFAAAPQHPYPWAAWYAAWVAPVPALSLTPPELVTPTTALTADGWLLRARLRSLRDAPTAGVYVPGDRLLSARLGGEAVLLPPAPERDAWEVVEDVTVPAGPAGGVELELAFRGTEP
ncbi:MAG TPA: M28 family peptidase, partial [Thermoanaerobaculia bacterium]|nr:M28 family peptidase [Thermoanaerobaculia bacterium]